MSKLLLFWNHNVQLQISETALTMKFKKAQRLAWKCQDSSGLSLCKVEMAWCLKSTRNSEYQKFLQSGNSSAMSLKYKPKSKCIFCMILLIQSLIKITQKHTEKINYLLHFQHPVTLKRGQGRCQYKLYNHAKFERSSWKQCLRKIQGRRLSSLNYLSWKK